MIAAASLTGLVDLMNPNPATITLPAIAHGLAQVNRWNGATETPFSTAQHSVLVREIFIRTVPELSPFSLYALKHDAHEYVLGDITEPFVALVCEYDPQFRRRLEGIKARLDRAIEARFNLPAAPAHVLAAIDAADTVARHLEWRAFVPADNGHSPFQPKIRFPNLRPKPMAWVAAADEFKQLFELGLAEKAWAA